MEIRGREDNGRISIQRETIACREATIFWKNITGKTSHRDNK